MAPPLVVEAVEIFIEFTDHNIVGRSLRKIAGQFVQSFDRRGSVTRRHTQDAIRVFNRPIDSIFQCVQESVRPRGVDTRRRQCGRQLRKFCGAPERDGDCRLHFGKYARRSSIYCATSINLSALTQRKFCALRSVWRRFMRVAQIKAGLAQWPRRRSVWGGASGLALALAAAAPARADGGYVGDLPIFENSGATVWNGAHDYSEVVNPAGASILNQGQATAEVVGNGGVVRNAPGATWNGDLSGNVAGAKVVNQGQWNGALDNSGGGVDNSGTVASVNNAAGVFTNEGIVSGALANGGQATNSGEIAGKVVNSGIFVNNAAGSVGGGLLDTGSTANNGEILGGVTESGAFTNNASGKVSGGFTLDGGSAVNNGEIRGGVAANGGAFTDNEIVRGGAKVAGAGASLTVNGVVDGKTNVIAGSLVLNSAGALQGNAANAGALDNAGAIHGSVVNAGSLVNAGVIDGFVRQTGGQTTNDGTIAGAANFRWGAAVNNATIGGALEIGAAASVIDNGVVGGATINQGAFAENGSGALKGVLLNKGQATINGDLAGGAISSGEMVVNASGRVENGLVVSGGSTSNAGVVSGGAVVRSGVLATSGEISGGLVDAGLVKATGVISGPVDISGKLVVGDGTANAAKLTIAPGSTVAGVITMPVNLSTGQSNFLSARGVSLGEAQLDLTGKLVNASGAYWGALSISDAPIALTAAARQALAVASGPLYRYSDPLGTGIVQTINSGLGVTAFQVTVAAATAFAEALGPAPSDFERAPADPTPNLGAGSVWSRGFGADLTFSGDNHAGTGPAFDATRLSTRIAGAEIGFEYGLHNIQNSGMSLRVGVAGGDGGGAVSDAAGSGATAAVSLPFVGAYATLTGLGFTGHIEARYARVDMQLTDAPLSVFSQSQGASGMIYAAQASYRIPAGAVFVEPTAGLSYARLAIADEPTSVGDLSFGQARLTLGHAGVKIGGDFSAGALNWSPYALASLWREWLAGATITVPQGPTIAPSGQPGFEEVGLGVRATLAHSGLTGFAEGAWAFGPRIAGLAATGGARYDF